MTSAVANDSLAKAELVCLGQNFAGREKRTFIFYELELPHDFTATLEGSAGNR